MGAEHIMSKKMEMVFQQAAIKVGAGCLLYIVKIDFRFTGEADDKKEQAAWDNASKSGFCVITKKFASVHYRNLFRRAPLNRCSSG